MALTMLRIKQFATPIALALLLSGGAVSAQINPTVAKSAAQNAAQTANKSATQTSSTSATQTPEKKTSTSATQTPAPHDKKPADQQKAPPAPEKKPATPEKKPVVTEKKPAADKKPAATEKKPAAADKKPAAADKKPAATDKKPVTPAPAAKTAPAQKVAPPKDVKKTGDVVKTTKPALPQGRRDPFIGLVGRPGSGGPNVKLPPGKGGLQVSTIILQGIVSGPNGMIAVVANPQKSVYFLRVGDELFDGRVEKIEIGSVTFHEVGKDAFGKPVEREVTRKLNPSSGDQP
jgi:outer membrane biosynthesis protein TonB